MFEFIPPGTRFFALPSPFKMKGGKELHDAHIAYETWGTLNQRRDNAILIVTGLSPNAHAASHVDNTTPGWWEAMLGPGKPIDTRRWFVICVNSLGSCKGSTGPASIHPTNGQPYRLAFPELSIEDIADAAYEVVKGMEIDRLACIIGNSMGGMIALAYLLRHPGASHAHINVSGSAQALPFSIAIRSLQREAIRLDPHWNNGNYDEQHYPAAGMRIARKLGVITYRSSLEWDGRFSRIKLESDRPDEDPFGMEFQIESYLEGHARRFIYQFDPNCYLYLSRSMDWFDLADYADGDVMAGLAQIKVDKALTLGARTDILFPIQQQEQIAEGLALGGANARCIGMDSPQGHDAFLVDIARFGPAIGNFLKAL